MFNLYEILRNAQGGQAIDNLAAQFNMTSEEADAAVKAIVPELSEGFLKQASQPLGIASFFGALGEGQHLAAFTDPEAAQSTATAQKGGDILNQLLGSHRAQEEIAVRAASTTGMNADVLSQMLPVIVSMIVGGLNKSLQSQGFGGIIGQLANAAGQGNLGGILGQILGGKAVPPEPPSAPTPEPAGGPGGLGSILGQILGGGRNPAGPGQSPTSAAGASGGLGGLLGSILGNLAGRPGTSPAAGPSPSGGPQIPGFDPASIQAGLEALTKMLQPGTTPPAAGAPQSGVEAEISDIMSGKRR